ncbi:MAG: transporter substrate-binding domain-containing protein [Oscillospiraceae bacterium]|nr:transporter substrate-binding domain-containing protein [Oscillospiraceae bacterium]
MKRIIAMLLVLALCCGVLAGCGKGGSKKVWKDVVTRGEFAVGVDISKRPFSFYDETGAIVGFDVDLAEAIANQVGLPLNLIALNEEDELKQLEEKNVDFLMHGIIKSSDTEAKLQLSKAYINNKVAVFGKGAAELKSADAIKGLKLGSVKNSAALEALKKSGATAQEFGSYRELINEVAAGKQDAAVLELADGEYYNSVLAERLEVAPFSLGDRYCVIVCRKGESALSDKINEALDALVKSGKAEEISKKWFGKNIFISK